MSWAGGAAWDELEEASLCGGGEGLRREERGGAAGRLDGLGEAVSSGDAASAGVDLEAGAGVDWDEGAGRATKAAT